MVIICIPTSINTHGKYSNPQARHFNYDAIIRKHEIIYNMEFIIVNVIYKGILKLVLLPKGPLQVFMKNPKNVY